MVVSPSSPAKAVPNPDWAPSVARYASIVQNAVEGIFQSTPDGRYLLVNPALAHMYGYGSPEELLASVSDISRSIYVDPSVRDEFKRLMARDGQVRGLEYQVRRKDGTPIWIEEHARAVRDDSGRVLYYEGFIQDITRRHEAEHALRAAKIAAEAANEAKSQFLAMMSHELRTPMNGIIGMASLLLDSPLASGQRDFAQTIRNSGDSLLTILNDILDFSKIESGHLELERHTFDPRKSAEDALDLFAPKAAEKGIELLYEISDTVPACTTGDASRLRQIIVNLLANALKFTQHGEILLKMEASPSPDRHGSIQLACTISDTGIGIPPEAQARLFRPFVQVDASTTRRFGGTGLGLAICHRLVSLMGGTISVQSTEGQGSHFKFTLPLDSAPADQLPSANGAPAALTGKRVLIVDDNATNLRILAHLARHWRMLPHPCHSGAEALALLHSGEHFDCAILDMHMPGMDGAALARAIRTLDMPAPLPLVRLSAANAWPAHADASQNETTLAKPAKPALLAEALARLCAHTRPAHPSSAVPPAHPPAPHAERLLLVEDNRVNQRVALHMLTRLGFRADVAGNGLEALDALARQPYDIILMDVQMPEMDGLEANRRIRDTHLGARTPWIIAITANAMQGDRELCLAAGMDDYVSKPMKPDELAAALARAHLLPTHSRAHLPCASLA